MATPNKRLDMTIANLATRLDATTSPKPGKVNASPRTCLGTPTRKKVELCDKGQNIYNRICKDLINSTRTPTKEKAPTPSKFFKSRTTIVATELILTKSVSLSICNEPQEYITDVVKVNKFGRKYKKNIVLVKTVMPLYNIQVGIDAQEHIEIVADLVEEVIESASRYVTTGRKMESYSERTVMRDKAKAGGSESAADLFHLLEDGKKSSGGMRKRKGSLQKVQSSSKRSKIIYNNADSSDDDDAMFISTSKPIISADDKKEMNEILGVSDDQEMITVTMTDHEASNQIIDVAGKKRREGAQ